MKKSSLFLILLTLNFALCACGKTPSAADEIMPEEPVDQISNSDGDEAAAPATSPTTPETLGSPTSDAQFTTLPDGQKLSQISVSGAKLSLSKGHGEKFSSDEQAKYRALKHETQNDRDHKVQWVFMDLDAHRVIEKSLGSDRRIFGASSSKIYVAATLLDKQNGKLSSSQLQLMANMLVVSSNEAWVELQRQVGDGSADKGRERIHAFTQAMGYKTMRGFQGTWGKIHGNELVADESAETLFDIYTAQFPGAEILWKIIHTCRTGSSRGRKYIPSNIYVGGKTGTYDGPTENPETGGTYTVHVRNHILVFNISGHQYGLVVFANSGSDESAALLAGGLIREHAGAP